MKRIFAVATLLICFAVSLSGCGQSEPVATTLATDQTTATETTGPVTTTAAADLSFTVSDRNIPVEDITDFYYTYENINYNAFYQRYRFYVEDGNYLFYHETRERPEDYGWTTEEDITASGTLELSQKEWQHAFELLKDGTVDARKDTAEAGSSGPWTFIYWKNDKSIYQEYQFASYDDQVTFEEFCAAMAQRTLK